MILDNKVLLITGGTGSFGNAVLRRFLSLDIKEIRIFSRDEKKQDDMRRKYSDDRLKFYIGDVRDYESIMNALIGVDYIFHAAALKHVPVIEYNPFEAVKTNVIGSQNVIDACIQNDIKIAVGVGTDKAVSPLNTYGATKLLMEKLFVSASNYTNPDKHRTRFIALRYGNVLGSSGSVVPKFIQLSQNHNYPKLQFESLWTLTNIASLSDETYIVSNNAHIQFIKLLTSSQYYQIKDQAMYVYIHNFIFIRF